VYPGAIKEIVLELRKQKLAKRESKMKKYVIVKSAFAKKLKKFISKRKGELIKPGRFIGLMQEDRKKESAERKKYSDVKFDFDLIK